MVEKLPPRAQSFANLMSMIRVAAKTVIRVADAVAAEKGLSSAEMTLLTALSHFGDSTVPDIARLRNLKRQSIQATADRLLDRGYVRLVDNPAHVRSKLLRLTRQGRSLQKRIEDLATASMAKASKGFRKADLDECYGLLGEIAAKLDEQHPPE